MAAANKGEGIPLSFTITQWEEIAAALLIAQDVAHKANKQNDVTSFRVLYEKLCDLIGGEHETIG